VAKQPVSRTTGVLQHRKQEFKPVGKARGFSSLALTCAIGIIAARQAADSVLSLKSIHSTACEEAITQR
jgi:hypothetical protein